MPLFIEKISSGVTIYIVTDYQGVLDFKAQGYHINIVTEKPNHAATLITLEFLIPESRSKSLSNYYLLKITK